MAAGTQQNFVIYNEQYHAGAWEKLSQVVEVFNESSANTLQVATREHIGHFSEQSFYRNVADVISHRDVDSTADVEAKKMEQDENVSVKINRRIGPVEQSIDSFKKLGRDPQEMSFVLGEMVAEQKLQDMVNTAFLCLAVALGNDNATMVDITADNPATISHLAFPRALTKMGDRASEIRAIGFHSNPFYSLMQQAMIDKIFEVAGVVIASGNVPTLMKPTVIVDAPALMIENVAPTPNYFNTLMLTSGAVLIEESETETIHSSIVDGKANLMLRYQGEYAYTITLKGHRWDKAAGGENPTNAALGVGANWIRTHDVKQGPGVLLRTQ